LARSAVVNPNPSIETVNAVRALLSLKEGLVLADVSERTVRKDLESGRLRRRAVSEGNRLWFRWVDVVFLAGVYRNDFLTAPLRKRAWERVEMLDLAVCEATNIAHRAVGELWERCLAEDWATTLEIDNYVFINVKRVFEDVRPRMDLYAEGLKRIEERNTVLGGKPVFRGTRLSVHHVGKMLARDEPIEHILEDYPYLSEKDVRFAHLYYLAHPTLGRPPIRVEDPEDEHSEFPA